MLINLFNPCEKADDVEFQDLIRHKENHYEEGRDVNVNNLMSVLDSSQIRSMYNLYHEVRVRPNSSDPEISICVFMKSSWPENAGHGAWRRLVGTVGQSDRMKCRMTENL
jgi:hypothetical protein